MFNPNSKNRIILERICSNWEQKSEDEIRYLISKYITE